ncbi:hypothetical protein [Hyphomicrobium sp. 99]|uniref:hypothetical protein n=1 Tax=Hyphomicrobium sp. 99 TaxID=1163419 RepID=UPI0005F7FF20|nr:hypothetical protein [Hyphomicrobium sp. 99]
MIRIISVGLATAFFALPAVAEESSSIDAGKTAAFSAELANAANAEQARQQLAHQGYTEISPLHRESGRWVGTATKDGKTVFVAVIEPRAVNAATE